MNNKTLTDITCGFRCFLGYAGDGLVPVRKLILKTMPSGYGHFATPRRSGLAYKTCVAAVWTALSLAADSAQAVTYTITDLGTLPGDTSSTADAINSSGQVVGNSLDLNKNFHAFVWSPGTGMVGIGTLPGDTNNLVLAINPGGQVVGSSFSSTNAHAYVWSPGTGMVGIGTLPGDKYGGASDINPSGQVVGSSFNLTNSTTYYHAYVWSPDTGMVGLGTLPGDTSSTALAINPIGQVAGDSRGLNNNYHAYVWSSGSGMVGLGTLPGDTSSRVSGINPSGQVTGYSSNSTGDHAFVWSPGTGMVGLGTLPGDTGSQAGRINSSGQVVGVSSNSTSNHAFVWSPSTGMVDLNSLLSSNTAGWKLTYATAINDAGLIVGQGTINGQTHAFLLKPDSIKDTQTSEDCLFNWAEKNYPSFFAPSGAATAVTGVYRYRYFTATHSYLGVSSSDGHVYYVGPNGGAPQDLGTLYGLLPKTSCPVPAPNDCLFNWAEKNYPNLFAPSGATTAFSGNYTYRYYSSTNDYLVVSSADNNVYYQGVNGQLQNQGPLTKWLPLAGCQ